MNRFKKQIHKTEDKYTNKGNNIPYRKRKEIMYSAVCVTRCGGNKQELTSYYTAEDSDFQKYE